MKYWLITCWILPLVTAVLFGYAHYIDYAFETTILIALLTSLILATIPLLATLGLTTMAARDD